MYVSQNPGKSRRMGNWDQKVEWCIFRWNKMSLPDVCQDLEVWICSTWLEMEIGNLDLWAVSRKKRTIDRSSEANKNR